MIRHASVASWKTQIIVVLAGLLGGCSKPEPIRRYTVERPPLEHRLLGAIVPGPNQSWFFKVTGPNERVSEARAEFEEFLASLRFAGEEPTWTLPAGWKRRSGGGMRFATLELTSGGAPLELSVIALPTPPGTQAEYLLANINRWRGQLQLGRLALNELETESTKLVVGAERDITATLVEFEGRLAASGGSPPFASRAPRAGSVATRTESGQIHFNEPDGWQPAERSSSGGGLRIERAAAFTIRDGEQKAEVSVTRLGAAAADRLSNINRWRGQVGLPSIAASELELEEIKFAGAKGDYVELIGAEQAILGVIAVDGGSAWFTKLQGPHDLAVRERERFKEFVSSIHFDH